MTGEPALDGEVGGEDVAGLPRLCQKPDHLLLGRIGRERGRLGRPGHESGRDDEVSGKGPQADGRE